MKKSQRRSKISLILIMALVLSCMMAIGVLAADKTLQPGKQISATGGKDSTKNIVYYKVVIKKTGLAKFEYSQNLPLEDSFAEVNIYDKNKKLLIENSGLWLKEGQKCSFYAALKKGTYYLGINDGAIMADEDLDIDAPDTVREYKVKYTFTTKSIGKKVANKKKAPTLVKKKKVSGLVFVTDSKKENVIYKFTTSKKQKVSFKLDLKTNDVALGAGIELFIYNSKGKSYPFKGDSVEWFEESGTYTVTLPAGTYYFCVDSFENGSGYYELMIK